MLGVFFCADFSILARRLPTILIKSETLIKSCEFNGLTMLIR
jgi:hypothetical protein